jgi:hypothetical protein
MKMTNMLAVGAIALGASASVGHAFCGFYVSGSGQKMFADATSVVLMRSGTRTILSMQNDYRGPLEDFAMVVPVPVVLKETDVKVVPKVVLERLDSLSSPRLVEYWEEDPCPPPAPKYPPMRRPMKTSSKAPMMDMAPSANMGAGGGADYASKQEAERMMVAPILGSFAANPPAVTAKQATNITWTFAYSNQPYPEPTCTVDHGVGNVYNGAATPVTIDASTTFKLTCANGAGKTSKDVKINVVTVEAKFDVAEYKILILSAAEATGLDQWLKLNNYKIPEGAEPLLRPYVESGSKFFVAKVDPKKVQMVDGRAALSPLRFHYDSEEFSLPIRLGMANSPGKQDLIVNILSPDKRYEVANYKNVTIPTNFDVKTTVKGRFGEFYAALFDKTVEKNPGAVITEYAWTATPTAVQQGIYGVTCDPCPSVIPIDGDMMQLGADVVGPNAGQIQKGGYVLTRLHARYGKTDMKDDLRFKEAKPITGGREVWSKNGLEFASQPGSANYFQARYAVRHWWTGPIKCSNPRRGVWGGPPDGASTQVMAATKTAYAPRGKLALAGVVKRDLWELGVKRDVPPPTTKNQPPGGKTMWFGGGALLGAMLLGAGALARRRRRNA